MCDCEERDFVTFTDDDGNEFELDIIDYFDYEGNEYAILIDSDNCECENEDECNCEPSVYIMRIIVNEEDDTEEFVSPAEEDMDALIEIVQTMLEEMDDECECDSDCECESDCNDDCECGCGCHKE